jgi:hypothetical protein
MNTPRISIIDDIIRNWFPIIGILFLVAGMSYLFYEGIWHNLNEVGRLTLGFLCGVLLISGSYPLEKASKIVSDSLLAGGLLMLYVSLIFGSRFEATEHQALIPEVWALIIATLFTLGVAFFSYARHSRYVLLIGIAGGYLTPFFIGQSGQFNEFVKETGVFQYNLPVTAFLLYFLAINIAILLTANKFFLKGIGLLNTLGLFVGTASLSYFIGGQFPNNANQLAMFSVTVFGLHIAAMAVNARRFEKEADPYLIAGYLLPLVWYSAMLNAFVEPYFQRSMIAGLMFGSAIIYFAGWHYLRQVIDRQQHTSLYLGGSLSVVMAVIKLQHHFQHYDGLIFALVAQIFGSLYILRPVPQREIAFLLFACFGVLMTLLHLYAIDMPSLWFLSGTTIAVSFTVTPFLLGGFFPQRKDEGESLKTFREVGSYMAFGSIIVLVFLDLVRMDGIPKSLLLFTMPAAITAYASYSVESTANKITLIKLSLLLSVAGFCSSLLIVIGRFYPFPSDVQLFATPESFMGAATLAVIFILKLNIKRLSRAAPGQTNPAFGPVWTFFMVFSLYTTLWAAITHEIMALFNSLDIDIESKNMRGIRAFATTIWWVSLAGWMIFLGVKNNANNNQKNIGFGLFALTIFKILFVDLYSINTNLKVFVFMMVGIVMLTISFFANKQLSAKLHVEGVNLD